MTRALVISVRLLEGRYHGAGDWPPAPARAFQALIAGVAIGCKLPDDVCAALEWLEGLPVPLIGAPKSRLGQRYTNYVPNNDLDFVDGDPQQVGEIRDGKVIQPRLFDAKIPLIYCWLYDESLSDERNAEVICAAATQVYQLGRGVDIAFAWGEVIDARELAIRLENYQGALFRPALDGTGTLLDCPSTGTLASLQKRYAANLRRFSRSIDGKRVNILLTQAPKPRFQAARYNCPSFLRLFELRSSANNAPFARWSQCGSASLVVRLRDTAADRLADALPDLRSLVARVLIGRDATEPDKATRVRIIPLPSIGHVHVDQGIRRVLVEVPGSCEISGEDIAWAFSGLLVSQSQDQDTGEVLDEVRLTPAADLQILRQFGVESGERNRLWRTVTPAALPKETARRRINPNRLRADAKGASERQAEEGRASTAVLQALRHAGVLEKVELIKVQREPFAARGTRAEQFAAETRFSKDRLWHIEILFAKPVYGPVLIGDGRYLGLGLMAPVRRVPDAFSFAISGGLGLRADPEELSRALRRAVMARVQEQLGRNTVLPAYFSGHAPTGEPLREGKHQHLAFAADLPRNRLLILPPHLIEHRAPTAAERRSLAILDGALEGLTDLRAGASGRLALHQRSVFLDDDSLFAPARQWECLTKYQPTRYTKRVTAIEALVIDALGEIRRLGFPEPVIDVLECCEGPRSGVSGRLRLRFDVVQTGPILIGRTRHFGGGLFESVQMSEMP